MKIIMSPAKEMATDVPVQKDWVLTEDSQKIVSLLSAHRQILLVNQI